MTGRGVRGALAPQRARACPFCCGEAWSVHHVHPDRGCGPDSPCMIRYVECSRCGARGPHSSDTVVEVALRQWNIRLGNQPVRGCAPEDPLHECRLCGDAYDQRIGELEAAAARLQRENDELRSNLDLARRQIDLARQRCFVCNG